MGYKAELELKKDDEEEVVASAQFDINQTGFTIDNHEETNDRFESDLKTLDEKTVK